MPQRNLRRRYFPFGGPARHPRSVYSASHPHIAKNQRPLLSMAILAPRRHLSHLGQLAALRRLLFTCQTRSLSPQVRVQIGHFSHRNYSST